MLLFTNYLAIGKKATSNFSTFPYKSRPLLKLIPPKSLNFICDTNFFCKKVMIIKQAFSFSSFLPVKCFCKYELGYFLTHPVKLPSWRHSIHRIVAQAVPFSALSNCVASDDLFIFKCLLTQISYQFFDYCGNFIMLHKRRPRRALFILSATSATPKISSLNGPFNPEQTPLQFAYFSLFLQVSPSLLASL